MYPQKIRLQHVKGHSGDVGNDGADAMANIGTLLPVVEDRDWEALEMKLSEQLEKGSVEIYILYFNRIMRIVYWMMEILPRIFLMKTT
jgi:hypothetical protein